MGKYKRKLGSRRYRDYTQQALEDALKKVVVDKWSIRKSCREFNIPFGTLRNKFLGQHHKSPGGQQIFTNEEEMSFITAAAKCGEWGFPLTKLDMQMVVKNFLDSTGRIIKKFTDNKPGTDWVNNLLKRHKNEVTERVAANIKRVRASVDSQILKQFYNNLQQTLEGIPASNVFNYDETNVTDDPGKKKHLYRRGVKYPELVCNFTKSSTTIMICGSASGILLPPYIIYRAQKMWKQWTLNGPKGAPCCQDRCCSQGARYNSTNHGWMDAQTFGDWFSTTFLPHAKNLPGEKVLIGDNLAAHFTTEVLQLCEENQIKFVCLPPNSTHICQPLDVSFFRPMKIAWWQVLLQCKMRHRNSTTVEKSEFPNVLQQCLLKMEEKDSNDKEKERSRIKRNLISEFSATGIYPVDVEKALSKLPKEPANPDEQINDTLVAYLKEKRFGDGTASQRKHKRKRVIVEPGKSVVHKEDSEDEDEKLAEKVEHETNNSDIEDNIQEENDVEEIVYSEPVKKNLKVGTFVLIELKSGKRKSIKYTYAGIIQNVDDEKNSYQIMGLKSIDNAKKIFKCVDNDIFDVDYKDIKAILAEPIMEKSGERWRYVFHSKLDVKEV